MEIVIKEACTVTGEAIAEHVAVGQTVEVSKDEATTLTRMGRALYLNKADDPSKGAFTASKEDVTALTKQGKAILAAEATRASPPDSQASIIAAAVTAALAAAGLKPAIAVPAPAA
ncbi:MAG: hypothetical protein ACRCV9_16410 [Burkholderiaceae bacterium]